MTVSCEDAVGWGAQWPWGDFPLLFPCPRVLYRFPLLSEISFKGAKKVYSERLSLNSNGTAPTVLIFESAPSFDTFDTLWGPPPQEAITVRTLVSKTPCMCGSFDIIWGSLTHHFPSFWVPFPSSLHGSSMLERCDTRATPPPR